MHSLLTINTAPFLQHRDTPENNADTPFELNQKNLEVSKLKSKSLTLKYPWLSHRKIFSLNQDFGLMDVKATCGQPLSKENCFVLGNSSLASYFPLKIWPLPLWISFNLPCSGYGYFLEVHNMLLVLVLFLFTLELLISTSNKIFYLGNTLA